MKLLEKVSVENKLHFSKTISNADFIGVFHNVQRSSKFLHQNDRSMTHIRLTDDKNLTKIRLKNYQNTKQMIQFFGKIIKNN